MLSAAGESDQGSLYIAPSIQPLLETFKLHYSATAEQSLERAEAALAQPSAGESIDIRPQGPLYTGWKIQRLMDLYRTVQDAQRDEADALMEAAGFLDICRHEADWRIELVSGVLRVKQVTA
jgi:hypothetical protein